MRVFVVGATGVLGRQTLPRLVERGHHARALVRSAEQAARLNRMGIEAVQGDILDRTSVVSAVAGCDAALHLATAIPHPGGATDWTLNDRIRREGTRNLVEAAFELGVRRYVQQSITFLYGDQGSHIADEATPLQAKANISSSVDMEEMVRASSLEWVILRGGAFYGPGTGAEDRWRRDALAGTLRVPGEGDALQSLIHAVDMARAVVLALESAPAGSTYNVVDDEPVTYRDLYGYVAAQVGAPEPQPDGAAMRSLGCTNAALKAALGWSPLYATYRSGLAS
ncbi:MAG: NAD-dependent epimerase/dehydratase [Ktedonobacterales bacterium]|jgi:nucleoside-diphosphate-sugar epimerase|nr:MAG: NAD-dependent epimerase/dehydratase [Ktedonobacterales bacterium]